MTKEQILNNSVVENFAQWEKGNMSRCYLTLKGKNKSWRGDQTTKVYWDNNNDTLVITRGKGLTSSEFEASLQTLEAL